MDEPDRVWIEVRKYLEDKGFASITDLNRLLPVNRNWLAGFLSACECFGYLNRRGTRTFKIYTLAEAGRKPARARQRQP